MCKGTTIANQFQTLCLGGSKDKMDAQENLNIDKLSELQTGSFEHEETENAWPHLRDQFSLKYKSAENLIMQCYLC